jgi:hypothetical protein
VGLLDDEDFIAGDVLQILEALLSSRGGADDSGRITILVYHCFSRSTFLVICDRSFDADASFPYPSFDQSLRTKPGVDHANMGGPSLETRI